MKKLFLLFSLILLASSVYAQSSIIIPTVDPNKVIIDNECIRRILIDPKAKDADGNPVCNRRCQKWIVDSGFYCVYGSEDVTGSKWEDQPGENLTGGSPDMLLIYIRAGLYVVLAGVSIAMVLYGIYGWYSFAMSQGDPEKVKNARKIYTNAAIGGIIVLVSFIIVQLLGVFFGVTSSVLDFSFIPKSGLIVNVRDTDIGRSCFSEQVDVNDIYECIDGKWQKK